jgi:hypothetical protein
MIINKNEALSESIEYAPREISYPVTDPITRKLPDENSPTRLNEDPVAKGTVGREGGFMKNLLYGKYQPGSKSS